MSRITTSFESYLPEALLLNDKHRRPSRLCREEYAVISPGENYRILTRYGNGVQAKADLFGSYGIDRKQRKALENKLQTHRHILLESEKGSILLFADWMETGLLLSLCLPESHGTLLRALGIMSRTDFTSLTEKADTTRGVDPPLDDAVEHLSELFYYLDRILSPAVEIGLLTRTSLIAELIGCQADCSDLPVGLPGLIPQQISRLTAFLFCALLTLRNESVAAEAEEGQESPPSPRRFRCRLKIADTKETLPAAHLTNLDWTESKAFKQLEICAEDGVITAQTDVAARTLTPQLNAFGTPITLLLILEKI